MGETKFRKWLPPYLTRKQWKVYRLIRESICERGFPPTRTEIADTLGYKSINSVSVHVEALVAKGAIEVDRGLARGLRLCETGLPWELKTSQGEELLLIWMRQD